MAALAYLGPEGTFSHRAALDLRRDDEELLAFDHAEEVVQAAASGRAESAVIAFENSLEGPVAGNLDLVIAASDELLVTAERLVRLQFHLWRRPGDDAPLAAVSAHAFGLAQCSRFIRGRDLRTRVASSNGVACREVAAGDEPGWGALAGPDAGERFGLVAVEEDLHDAAASTRFLRLGRRCPAPTGRDLSMFVLAPDHLRAGSLVGLLQEFAARGINLTAIKSRPTRESFGEYVFLVEAEGHLRDARMRDATAALLRSTGVRYLGSYPQDDARDERRAPTAADADVSGRLDAMLARTEEA